MSTSPTYKRSEDIQVGDLIFFLGTPHLITSTDTVNAFGWRVAKADGGWSHTLEPGGSYRVG